MKALILAAGFATRLGDVALNKPKHLLEVAGRPVLNYVFDILNNLKEIDEILLISNDKFYLDFNLWKEKYYSKNNKLKIINNGVRTIEEKKGAIGDINHIINERKIKDDLLIVGGDNLFEDDLQNLMSFFKQKNHSVIMLKEVESKEIARRLGIVTLDDNSKIINFFEKPENPESLLASTLIYALKQDDLGVLKEVLEKGLADRSGDFIAYLARKREVYGLKIKGRWFDIGSIDQLQEAEKAYWKKEEVQK